MQHLIIGAGPAGVIAAETLRKLDAGAGITLIGDEPEPPYSRMALPYYLIDKIDERGTFLRKDEQHFQDHGIDLRRGRVSGIDTARRQVALEDGATLSYGRLLIATGSRPVSPPIPGIDLPGILPCWTLEHGRRIAARAKPGARVVLMGAGFIGCIILEALAKRGVELTVIEMEDRMVPRMMNETAGNMIRRWCQEQGVTVHTSTRVTGIARAQGDVLTVELDNGESLPADLIISATGVRPNIEFLEGSGIDTDQGIVIDRHMQTGVEGVYAAGDVAQGLDFSTGEYSVQAIQPTAAEHGRIAARNMLGGHHALHQGCINMNVLDTLGLISSSFGLWMGVPGGDAAELHDPERYRYLALQFEGDVLVGATSLGLTQHVGVLRGLIQNRRHLGRWKRKLMQDPTRIMEAWLATTESLAANA